MAGITIFLPFDADISQFLFYFDGVHAMVSLDLSEAVLPFDATTQPLYELGVGTWKSAIIIQINKNYKYL